MKTDEIIDEVLLLPVEERAKVVDSILNSMPSDPEIERKWAAVARERLEELESGKEDAVPGEEVFRRIWDRLSK